MACIQGQKIVVTWTEETQVSAKERQTAPFAWRSDKLGPYEIVSALGAGGIGEVYRARVTRLDRKVAIKILGEQFSKDPIRKQRFEREA